MSDEQQQAFQKWVDEMASRDVPMHAFPEWNMEGSPFTTPRLTREEQLALPIRAFTIDWLAWELAFAAQKPFEMARRALVNSIPDGDEDMLDGGDDYLISFYMAGYELGIAVPHEIVLRPARLHS